MKVLRYATAALLLTSISASAKINTIDLSDWLPKLPAHTHGQHQSRSAHLADWIPNVETGMSAAQVLVMLGDPDWGVTPKGKIRWVVDPKSGVLRYSINGPQPRVVDYVFDGNARVKRIVVNGVVVSKGRRLILPDPLPRGVFWRK